MIHYKRYTFAIIGVILIVFGCALELYWKNILKTLIGQQMILSPSSSTYSGWKSSPLPLHLDVYLYNWTNPNDITNHNKKPIFKELGPYRFIEKQDKVNIEWHSQNSSISFNRQSYFYFDKNNSRGDLNDVINTVNALAVGSAGKSRNWSIWSKYSLSLSLTSFKQKIFVTKTADELLFTGYEEDMMNMAKSFSSLPFDRIGYFYTRNGSENVQGRFNVYTGADDFEKVGQIYKWNDLNQTFCAPLTGSSGGEFFPKNLNITDTLKLFVPDLCGLLVLDYVGTVTIHDIEGYKFIAGPKSVDNGTNYNITRCPCSSECYPSGVVNLSKCKYDAPMFYSYPHYLHADSFYVEQIEGLKANKDNHEFYIVVEPMTGSVIEIAARIQLNALIEPFPLLDIFKNVKKTFMPLLWSEQKVTISPEIAEDLKIVQKLIVVGYIISGLTVFLGIVTISWVVIIMIVLRTKEKKRKDLYPVQSPLLDHRKMQMYSINQNKN